VTHRKPLAALPPALAVSVGEKRSRVTTAHP
jgi:hypothetical protein